MQSTMGCGSATLVVRLCGSAELRAGVPGSVKTVRGQLFGGRPRLRFTGRDSTSVLVSSVDDARGSEGVDAIGAASVREMFFEFLKFDYCGPRGIIRTLTALRPAAAGSNQSSVCATTQPINSRHVA